MAKLGAMMLKGYVAKAKGSFLECANCYERIHSKTECACEDSQNLINSLKDQAFLNQLHSITYFK